MFSLLRRFAFGGGKVEEAAGPLVHSVGEGRRVYAIGDVHGRHDLLSQLFDTIILDALERGPVHELRFVLLGDLVDRGPDSDRVVDLAIALARGLPGMTCLMGNHEEMFTMALRGDVHALDMFRRVGRETLVSYGIDPQVIDDGEDETLLTAMMTHVPKEHRDFLVDLPDYVVIGDYLFVHAGIRPGVPLDEQSQREMHWIRGDFLNSRKRHSHMVVHGHSISESVDEQPNRIGIDTGAYASDRLTAIGLEGAERWYLST